MAIDLDSIDIATAASANYSWKTHTVNEETGIVNNSIDTSVIDPADFLQWSIQNLNSEHMTIINDVKQQLDSIRQDSIDNGDLVILDNGTYQWVDVETCMVAESQIDSNLLVPYQKIYYKYALDRGLIT